MNTHQVREALRLSSGDLLCIVHGFGMQVSVQYGTLLATQEHDPNDTLVTTQTPFLVERQGKTILTARCDASVLLDGRAVSIMVKRYCGPTPVVLYRLPSRNVLGTYLGKLLSSGRGDFATGPKCL